MQWTENSPLEPKGTAQEEATEPGSSVPGSLEPEK